MNRTPSIRRGLAVLSSALAIVVLAWFFARASGDEAHPIRTVVVPTPTPPVTVIDTLKSGQTLGEVLESRGVSGIDIVGLVEAIGAYANPRRLRPGTEVRLAIEESGFPAGLSLRLDPDRTLHVFATDGSQEDSWASRLDSVPVTTDTILVAGLVESNLYEAHLSGDVDRLAPGEIHDITFRIAQVFQWQIDFWRDLRADDAYRVAIQREVRPDGTMRSAELLAAEFRNGDTQLTAVRFRPEDSPAVEYYDRDGEALRSVFLFAPVDLARVTSGFSRRRFHPILRRARPHLGVDYGAPRGTPVRATAPGVVTRAGRWGGYGLAVEIRHANNIRTRYAHLSSINTGVRAGMRIEQGRQIGRVGSTGLSTASHLHYEFLRNGSQVNPARLNLPKADPVPTEDRPRFEQQRDSAIMLLARVGLPGGQAAGTLSVPAAGGRSED